MTQRYLVKSGSHWIHDADGRTRKVSKGDYTTLHPDYVKSLGDLVEPAAEESRRAIFGSSQEPPKGGEEEE